MKTINLFLLLSFFYLGKVQAELPEDSIPKAKGYIVHGIVVDQDTLPYIRLDWVTVEAPMSFKTKRKYAQWTRIKSNVKIVYPYAILAAAKLKEYDRILAQISDEDLRKKYTKHAEKQLEKEFGAELRDLSVNQGKILMKLIDRETGKTTYQVVKEMRGNFSAFMWQSLAVLFGSTMKQEYDPEGEDRLIELAIRQVENGEF